MSGPLFADGVPMRMIPSRMKARVAMVTIVSLLGSPIAPLVAQTTPAQTATAQTPKTGPAKAAPAKASPAKAAAVPPPDGGWPRAYTTASGAALVFYQPQIAEWKDQKHVIMYAAVSYMSKGATKAALGTIKVESDTSVALDERLVSFSDFTVEEPNFPTLQRDQLKTVVAEMMATMSTEDRVIALDRVLANYDASLVIPKNIDGIKADPPPIFFSQAPAVLVNIDGEPIWAPIKGNDLQSAVNTNWDLFLDSSTKTYYLRSDKAWMKADNVNGPWKGTTDLPDGFEKLPDDGNWAEVKANLPGWKGNPKAPKVFVSLVPAEMILLRGAPTYLAVQGAKQLVWVSNSESDVFRMGASGTVYFLISGRWFSSPGFNGPWTFATPTLPDDFKKIPLGHPRSRVLASVPGTTQAAEAVLLAQIPQTARVSKTLQAPAIVYQGGSPQFQPIEKTTVQTAVNTDKDVFKVGDLYYLCFQGVWFMSTTPNGPWAVTGDVPKAIYTIPVSSPSYNVTYVTVQESNNDAVVFATAMAFTGMMVAWGCVVWGSGYYYPPYHGFYGGYPYYYPRYPSYGYHASYNPWTGAYTRGVSAYGPYGGAGAAQRYNPTTGTYSRGAVAYGPYGAQGAAQAYNPRTGTYGQTRQGSNVYGSWGSTQVQRGDQWASTSRATNNVTGNTTRVTQGSGGGSAVSRSGGVAGNTTVAKSGSGDVYAGKDGNVYKKTGDSWQQYGGDGNWNSATKPTPTDAQRQQAQSKAANSGWDSSTRDQVNRDSAARAQGQQRTNTYSSGNARAGSYGGGGAARSGGGGGGRRR